MNAPAVEGTAPKMPDVSLERHPQAASVDESAPTVSGNLPSGEVSAHSGGGGLLGGMLKTGSPEASSATVDVSCFYR